MPRVKEVMHPGSSGENTGLDSDPGESGTGKSVVARPVHQQSHLADKLSSRELSKSVPGVLGKPKCSATSKGAFTGALQDHWGKVKAAAGGTLFLDEIGDLGNAIRGLGPGDGSATASGPTLHAGRGLGGRP